MEQRPIDFVSPSGVDPDVASEVAGEFARDLLGAGGAGFDCTLGDAIGDAIGDGDDAGATARGTQRCARPTRAMSALQ